MKLRGELLARSLAQDDAAATYALKARWRGGIVSWRQRERNRNQNKGAFPWPCAHVLPRAPVGNRFARGRVGRKCFSGRAGTGRPQRLPVATSCEPQKLRAMLTNLAKRDDVQGFINGHLQACPREHFAGKAPWGNLFAGPVNFWKLRRGIPGGEKRYLSG